MKLKPLKRTVYLDWADIKCPCGDSVSGRGGNEHSLEPFIQEHQKHSNGKIRTVYDPSDTLRVLTKVPSSSYDKIE